MNYANKVLTLDFAALKGWRSVLGLLQLVGPDMIDKLLGSSLCLAHPTICGWLKIFGTWFTIMGVRGA